MEKVNRDLKGCLTPLSAPILGTDWKSIPVSGVSWAILQCSPFCPRCHCQFYVPVSSTQNTLQTIDSKSFDHCKK